VEVRDKLQAPAVFTREIKSRRTYNKSPYVLHKHRFGGKKCKGI